MKKICIIFLSFVIISVTTLSFGGFFKNDPTMYEMNNVYAGCYDEYLRIHVRADSNENSAQAVKYAVRDKVVAYLTPLVATYQTKQEAQLGIEQNLENIAKVATETLREEGFSYGAKAEIRKEKFPTRVYDGYTLPAGEYSALIISLGRGEGDNWWCVVYPPLCFAGTGADVVYKSKIKEIIARWEKNTFA